MADDQWSLNKADSPTLLTAQPASRIRHRVSRAALVVSQYTLLAMLFCAPWRLEWIIVPPNFDVASLPNPANLPKLRPADVLAIVSIGAYLMAGWPHWQRLCAAKTRVWAGALIALTAWAALSITWAEHRGLAVAFTLHLALWVLVGLRVASDDLPPRSIALSLLGGLGLNAIIGIGQVMTQRYLGLSALGELPIELSLPDVSVIGVGAVRLIRLYGLSGHPNVIGGYAATALLVSVGLLREKRQLVRFAWLIGFIALLLTFSRAAWLAFAIGLVILIVVVRRRRTLPRFTPPRSMLVIAGVIASVWLIVFAPLLSERVMPARSDLELTSVGNRIAQSEVALRLIAARPITGVGIGNSGVASQSIAASAGVNWVHNVPLLVASELGLVGLTLWLIAIGTLIRSGLGRRSDSSVWRVTCFSAIIAMLIIMLFDHYLWTSSQGVYVWAALSGGWLGMLNSSA